MSSIPNKYVRLALPSALLVYCTFAALLILQKPGLQYDEALLVLGSVQMRISPHELTLPHDPDTWVCVFHRCFPLMTMRYIGAIKEYLCLPVFAMFGPSAVLLRLVSMLLGLLGIWGIAKLVREHAGLSAAAIAAWILAINPAYTGMTIFDNDAVAISMAAVGLLCLAISGYLRKPTASAAFWAGAALALVVWARANLAWLLAALLAAALIVLGKRLWLPVSHLGGAIAGGIVGGFPFLVYQFISKGGTLGALSSLASSETLGERLFYRLIMYSETLLSDRQHRAMWDGPMMPGWQRWLFPVVVLVGCMVNLISETDRSQPRAILARVVTLTFLFFGAILFLVRVPVSEHHLIALLPMAAVVTVLGLSHLWRYRWASVAIVALGAVYAGSAIYWQVGAIQGLRRTGGVGPWSDAITPLAEYLEQKYPNREVKILDWGLQDNLFVLTNGRLHSREIVWDPTTEQATRHRPWIDEIRDGGVFLMNGADNRQIPAATLGFLQALVETQPIARWFKIRQRSGIEFAEVVEIEPNTLGMGVSNDNGPASKLSTGDERFAKQWEGLYEIEAGAWRWSKREFSVTLGSPNLSGGGSTRLTLELSIPDIVSQKLGPITLTVRLGIHTLAPETYRSSGRYTFSRDVEAAWIHPGPNRIDFALDKSLPPSPADGRELGVVVMGASLEPK